MTNLSVKEDLERSLKEFISIDILNEENKFYCESCNLKARGKTLIL